MVSTVPSSFVPPTRMSSPRPAVMVSVPPMPSAVVRISPMVMGMPSSCGPSVDAAVICPESPKTRLLPLFTVMVSPAVPPITRSEPSPVVMVSAPP